MRQFSIEKKRTETKQTEKLKNPISKANMNRKAKQALNTFFNNVSVFHIGKNDPDMLIKCTNLYLDYDRVPGIGRDSCGFKTDNEKLTAIWHFIHAHFFREYGIRVRITYESCGTYLFCFYGAYLKGETKK